MNDKHVDRLDLNLLRMLEAVEQCGSVSRAAERLGMTQPAVSQALARLRRSLGDALFVRSAGGVVATPRAAQLAAAMRTALGLLEDTLSEAHRFVPARSDRTFRLHLSDIGEARFLPALMAALHARAPRVTVESAPLPRGQIEAALDAARIDLAIGYLPALRGALCTPLLEDRYVVVVRAGHPVLARAARRGALPAAALARLDFVAVRTHADTLRILQLLQLEPRLRLVAEHFMALPSIVRATDLAVVMPRAIAQEFDPAGATAVLEFDGVHRDFTVSLHWSRRFDRDPGLQWLRGLALELFASPPRPGQ